MNEFEFLSVLISIIFGLGLTHLLYGLFRHLARRDLDLTHAVLTAWVFMVLVLNWWVLYQWRDYQGWSFEVFLMVVLWALSFYVMSIALYPPDDRDAHTPTSGHTWFFWAALATCVLDIAWTATRGALFEPWYYLPFVGHYAVLFAVMIRVRSATLRRAGAWWMLSSILAWAFIVRRVVA
ncbi:MAG: hypothetical protein U1F08_04770 [Steroidobacteraceae bacterium]